MKLPLLLPLLGILVICSLYMAELPPRLSYEVHSQAKEGGDTNEVIQAMARVHGTSHGAGLDTLQNVQEADTVEAQLVKTNEGKVVGDFVIRPGDDHIDGFVGDS